MKKNRVEHLYLETELKNWKSIFELNQRFFSRFVYRGQSNFKWGLSTSLERQTKRLFPDLVDKSVIPSQEKDMIKEFQWKYPLYSTISPDIENKVEWLTIMQHYGAATRLLDFTYSIFVAMYMIVADNGESGALWAINKTPPNNQLFHKYGKLNNVKQAGQDALDQFALESSNEILNNHSFDSEIKKQLYIIKPQMCNERLSRQQGLFVMPSDVKCPFSECLSSYLHSPDSILIDFEDLIGYSHGAKYKDQEVTLIKIIIPYEMNYQIMKYLRSMNITAETLFPGLEGLAKSTNYARFSFNRIDQE